MRDGEWLRGEGVLEFIVSWRGYSCIVLFSKAKKTEQLVAYCRQLNIDKEVFLLC